MKKDLMDILACPMCKGDLQLTITEEKGNDVVAGTLRCNACRLDYPIQDAIPNLLPPDLRS